MKKIEHKVFINDTLLYIADVYDSDEIAKANGKIISSATTDIKDVIDEIEKHPAASTYFYLSDNSEASWHIFISYYTLIEASGGLVQNEKGDYLVIFRRGKWDLPKGKVEYDESPEEAGLREVAEECGVNIKELKITEPLALTFHTYRLKGKSVLKKTHWFRMQYIGKGKLKPQTEEDIEKAQWMSIKELKTTFYSNTYVSIKDLLGEITG